MALCVSNTLAGIVWVVWVASVKVARDISRKPMVWYKISSFNAAAGVPPVSAPARRALAPVLWGDLFGLPG